MKLTIDRQEYNLAPEGYTAPDYDAETLRSPEKTRTGRRLRLMLPHSSANDTLLGSPFNDNPHSAELTRNGACIHRGAIRLLSTSEEGYTVEIIGDKAYWAESAARSHLDDLQLGFVGYITPTDIATGWNDDRPVKFLPILRDSYQQRNSSSDLLPILQQLSPDDYHPFIQLKALMHAIFKQAGYTIESKFMESESFSSLYISGAYATRDITNIENRMGFRAVRLTTVTATADSLGRAYATSTGGSSSLGNIVETAAPSVADELGELHPEAFNNGNCFGFDGNMIVYRPTTAVSAGFEFHMQYTTDHRIATRDRLIGFDSVNLGTGGNIPFILPNRYVDMRSKIKPGTSYRAMVFGAMPDRRFRISYTRNGVTEEILSEFTGRTASVTTPTGGTCSNPALFIGGASNSWTLWQGDWAMYEGHIGETGQTTVEIRLRTPAQSLGPSTPKRFNTIFFYGAEPGMKLTLHTQCSVKPIFTSAPAYGARITEADVLRHAVRQEVLIEATQQLFNLRFCTDEQTKKVWIEPDIDFWDERRAIDWRARTDLSESIVWEEIDAQVHESRTYGYLGGDGATTRLSVEEGQTFGSWHTITSSYATIEGDQKRINPLFCPTLSSTESYTEAPSALVMQVGDRDDPAGDGINFTPRIVKYCGLRSLPAGERWGTSSNSAQYPFAAFHFAGDAQHKGFTLCFNDRDAVVGLRRYYQREEQINTRQRVTLTLNIEPHEYQSLFAIGSGAADVRWVFRISTGNKDTWATLQYIDKYNPKTASARCTFTLLPHD